MRIRSQLRFLAYYSVTVTVFFVATVYFGLLRTVRGAVNTTDFDRIRVHRIDVVESDGTPRLIISNRAEFPGSFFHNRETHREDRDNTAGMIFINDEGTEDGGLIYQGAKMDGKPASFSHLSFDQYDQDQTLVLGTSLQNGFRTEGIQLNDAPEAPITPALIAEAVRIKDMPHGSRRAAAWASLQKRFPALTERASLSRSDDGSVGLVLRDPEGHSRLELRVSASGEPAIDLLDRQGKVEKQLSLTNQKPSKGAPK